MITEDQIKAIVHALNDNLPPGTVLHGINMLPRVGFGDRDAKRIIGFIIAEREEDVRRFEQIVARGGAEYQREFGLTAAVSRQMDSSEHTTPVPMPIYFGLPDASFRDDESAPTPADGTG